MDAMTTQHLTPAHTRTLVFDFDGTVSLGTGPVLAYARAAATTLAADHASAFLSAVELGLEQSPSGQLPGTGAIDGYDLVRMLASQHGVDPATLGDAYLASRGRLATDDAPVVAPRGLADFLRFAREHANTVLATNAPDIRVTEAISALGLTGLFDAVYTSVGKPGGLDSVLDDWLPNGEVLSIGDVWINDLAPAAARGALTALVGSPDEASAPTYRADHLHELYPVIAAWLESPHEDNHSDRTTTATTTTMKGTPSVL
jgi:FMN phosphatase YigB (HAD superfamily)